MNTMQGKRVFVVEDDAITLRSLCERIAVSGEFKVGVACRTAREIRSALESEAPDVLLVDLDLPDGNGIDVIAAAVARYPSLPIMVITVFGGERQVIGAIRAGASGYLLKDDASHEIIGAMRQLLDGGSPISPAIARHLIRVFKTGTEAPKATANAAGQLDALTAHELEVLSLAAKGFSYAEIASMLALTTNTVASYTKRIYEKLAVNSRAEAVYEASRRGLISD